MNNWVKAFVGAHVLLTTVIVGTFVAFMIKENENVHPHQI